MPPISQSLMTLPELTTPPAETWADAASQAAYYGEQLRNTRDRFTSLVDEIEVRQDFFDDQEAAVEQAAAEAQARADTPPERRKILGIF